MGTDTAVTQQVQEFQRNTYTSRFDSRFIKESKNVLQQMLIAGNADPHAAVVTEDHLKEIESLISDCTRQLYQAFSIERSNYQAILRKLNLLSKTSSIVVSQRMHHAHS